jgi:hypothetical protein
MVSTTSLTSSSSPSAGSSAATASKVTFSTSGAGDSDAGAVAVAFDAAVLFSGGVTTDGSSFAALDVFELGVTLLQGFVIYIGIKIAFVGVKMRKERL